MKQVIAGVCIFVLAVGHAWAAEDDERVAASRATVKEFMQSLKGELQKGMQEGGPVNAIGVCNRTARGIANTYSVRNDWTVGRTSLKVRNPDNAPDTWEQAVLQEFDRLAEIRTAVHPRKKSFDDVPRPQVQPRYAFDRLRMQKSFGIGHRLSIRLPWWE